MEMLKPSVNMTEWKWWEKEPLRIVELEEGYEFNEKFEFLKDLGANMEHVTNYGHLAGYFIPGYTHIFSEVKWSDS